MLVVSKLDISPKNDVQVGIFTICELTGAKIGANVAEDKIDEKSGGLTIQTTGGRDTLGEVIAAVDNSVTKDVA